MGIPQKVFARACVLWGWEGSCLGSTCETLPLTPLGKSIHPGLEGMVTDLSWDPRPAFCALMSAQPHVLGKHEAQELCTGVRDLE